MKRFMAYLLSLCILISLVPTYSISAVAAEDKLVQISKKSFRLAPGVTEYELVTNDNDLSKQQVGHIMEISPDSSSEIRVGYNDYNIRAIASGSNWAMVRPTEQAQKAETAAQIDVIGVVNGDFFNMANGCPSGYTVMQGMTVRDVNSSCFWIDSAGKAHISANRAEVESICTQENVAVQEAVGGGAILVEDGQRTNAGGNYGDAANPRTVAGIKPDGTVILYMVNGRQAPYSVGMVYQEFEDAVYATDISGNYTGYNEKTGKYYYDYCDINSLVKVYLLQQLSLNSDSFASSLFFYKDAGAKLYAGPIWDMEMTCGTAWEEQLHPSRDFLQLRYLSEALQQIPSFQNAVKKYFQTAFSEKTRNLYGADGRIAAYYEKLADSVSMNSHLWPYVRVGSPTASNHLWREGTT